ncbi:MAG: ABC transporter permease [Myxococcales bacterium]|nr:ABC transporter permease [Myxococcales bacterium]MCB9575848.1 ABC transporter permease [Polyangiaceae bacterium]
MKPNAEAPVSAIARAWSAIGLPGRLGLILLAAVIVIWAVVWGLRRLGRRGRRSLLVGGTLISFLGVSSLGFWASRLPEPTGSAFILWHQLVRVGAALSGTFFIIGFMSLALPWTLNRIERRGFIPFVAVRHVRAGKSGFLTVISFLSIAGVAVSAFALCAVVSIMGGFGADLKRKILGNNAHMKIEAASHGGFSDWQPLLDEVRLVPGVRAATPVASGEAMASSSSNNAGTIIRGVDPETIGTVIDLLQNIEVGKFDYLLSPEKLTHLPPDEVIGMGRGGEKYLKGPDIRPWNRKNLDPDVADATDPVYPGIIIGRELAKTLHLYVGDEVTLVSPLGDLGPMGVMPRTRRFRVAAIFYSGMYEYDSSHVYMKLDKAQEFLDLKSNITGIEVKVDRPEQVDEVTPRVVALVKDRQDLKVRDWKESNKNLFSALKLEKIATFIILSIAIAVASFCIICTLLLMVTEKSKEIAIMKAVGASDHAILRVFMMEGVIIGAIGTIFGVVTGLVTVLGLLWFGVRLDPDVYYVDRLPISVDPVDYTVVAFSAMVITTLATVYPAIAASKLRPVDGIRYE